MAAGQGFKTFTTGEVLTAGDVNGYLMQGVLVFASTAARDAAITSPKEGQFAFTKDTNGLWYYDGAVWVASGATGDIEGVTAGVGISGGGTSGTVTITNSMATAIDAKGDLVAGTGADTFSKLTVGANDTILTADSTTATGLKWAAAAGGADNYTLINTGGTALTGATSITVSGISGKNSLFIFTEGDVAAGATAEFSLQFNNDTGSNYSYNGYKITIPSTVAAETVQNNTQITLGKNDSLSGYYGLSMKIDGTNATGIKPFEFKSYNGQTGASLFAGTGRYKGSSAISSIKITSSSGNFTAGTIYVFGA